MGDKKKTGKHWFPHDYGASQDFKLKLYKRKFKLKGIGVWWSLVEIMPELDEFSINFQPESDDLYFISEYVGLKTCELLPFIQGMIDCDLLIIDDNGNYYNKRIRKHIIESLGKEENYKRGNAGKNKKDDADPPQPPRKPKETPADVDKTPAKYQSLLDYWNSKNIVNHDAVRSDLKKAIDKRLKEYTPEQIKLAIDHYKNAVTVDEFWQTRAKEWTFALFLSRDNGMPKFLTWETKTTPSGHTGEHELTDEEAAAINLEKRRRAGYNV